MMKKKMDSESGKLIYSVERDDGGIQVRQNGNKRWIHLGSGAIQSAVDILKPHCYELEYMKRMMSFLMFKENIGRLLILGLGGGAMLRFINHYWPETEITAVDIDQDMIEIAEEYFGIPESEKIAIKNADAHFYLEQAIDFLADTMFIDVFIGDEPPQDMYNSEFLENIYRSLSSTGVAVFNLLPVDPEQFTELIKAIRGRFNKKTFCLTVPKHDNILLFAFKEIPPCINRDFIRDRIGGLSKKTSLNFRDYLKDFEKYNSNSPIFSRIK